MTDAPPDAAASPDSVSSPNGAAPGDVAGRLAAAFAAAGCPPQPVSLFGSRFAASRGQRVEAGGAEIIYRVEPGGLVWILLYRRLDTRRGLTNPFAGLIWFTERLIDSASGVTALAGGVDTALGGRSDGLDDHRLMLGYTEILGARRLERPVCPGLTETVVHLDLADYRPMRHLRRAALLEARRMALRDRTRRSDRR